MLSRLYRRDALFERGGVRGGYIQTVFQFPHVLRLLLRHDYGVLLRLMSCIAPDGVSNADEQDGKDYCAGRFVRCNRLFDSFEHVLHPLCALCVIRHPACNGAGEIVLSVSQ